MSYRHKVSVSDEVWSSGKVRCPECRAGDLFLPLDEGVNRRICASCGRHYCLIDGKIIRRLTDEERDWVAANVNLAGKMSRRLAGPGTHIADYGEAFNAALHGLIIAAQSYDPGNPKGASRATHACWSCRWSIVSRAKEIAGIRDRDRSPRWSTFTDCFVKNEYDYSNNPKLSDPDQKVELADSDADDPSRPLGVVDRLIDAIDHLPPRMAAVIMARMNGGTLSEIGKQLRISKEWVRHIEAQAIYRLKLAFGITADDPDGWQLRRHDRRVAEITGETATPHAPS